MEKKMNARKKAQRAARLRKQRNRRIALTLCLMFVVAFASIGGTIAWLTAKSTTVTNTFTASDINITLTETKEDFQMVPGNQIDKDPKVSVVADSEACWLFVEITESTSPVLDDYITYSVADGWKLVPNTTNVYYRTVSADDAETGVTYSVLANDKVTVKDTVTKTMMDAIDGTDEAKPTLTFTAYACQSANVTDVATAWTQAQNATVSNN